MLANLVRDSVLLTVPDALLIYVIVNDKPLFLVKVKVF